MIQKDGLITDGEAAMLFELSRHTEGIVVEIGSYTGKSTAALAGGGSLVFAVDLWDLHLPTEKKSKARNKKPRPIKFNSVDARKAFLERLAIPIKEGQVTPIRGESREVAKAWSREIGGLFIDGAHDANSVLADYLGWSKWLVPGGWIAFHDAHGSNGVMKVLDTVVKDDPQWTGWLQCERLAIAFKASEAPEEFLLVGDGSGEALPEASPEVKTTNSTTEDDGGSLDDNSDSDPVQEEESPPVARRPRRTKKAEDKSSDEV